MFLYTYIYKFVLYKVKYTSRISHTLILELYILTLDVIRNKCGTFIIHLPSVYKHYCLALLDIRCFQFSPFKDKIYYDININLK